MDLSSTVTELKLNNNVKRCPPSKTIKEVRGLLQKSKIGSIVIVEKGKVVGIFTERDYLMKIAGNESKAEKQRVSAFMTKNPKCVHNSDKITDVLHLMQKGGFRHVIVTDKKKQLVGVISIKDLMDFLLSTIDNLEESLKDLVACIA